MIASCRAIEIEAAAILLSFNEEEKNLFFFSFFRVAIWKDANMEYEISKRTSFVKRAVKARIVYLILSTDITDVPLNSTIEQAIRILWDLCK